MKRFQWKVVALMLLVSATPLIFSIVLVDQLLEDTVALGFDARLADSLDVAAETHRRYIQLRRRALRLEVLALASDAPLRDALGRDDDQAARERLAAWGREVIDPDVDIASVALRPAAAPPTPDEPDAPEPPQPAPPTIEISLDDGQRFPKETWRARAERAPMTDARGRPYELEVTFVVPWALFRRFEGLGQIKRTFEHLDSRQATLTSGYTQTFSVFSGAILLVTFLAGVLLARATTRRLDRLAEATAAVARGDLGVQVEVRGRDEIAQLTRAFNTMVVELAQSRDRLAYLERVSTWQEIARRLAHEIKNPLTPILLAVQQLDRKFNDYVDDPRRYRRLVSDAVEIVGEEVDSLRRLVAEFSDFARLPRVEPTPTDVGAFVTDLVRTNPQFAPHVAEVDITEGHDGAPCAGVDPTMLRRALINLVDNARQAIDNAGLPAQDAVALRVGPGPEGLGATITVEDRGPGVSPEHLGQLFDPYFTTKSDGTGLGLTIVKKIILDHGGDIRCESPLGDDGGTRFTITLPPADRQPSGIYPLDPALAIDADARPPEDPTA